MQRQKRGKRLGIVFVALLVLVWAMILLPSLRTRLSSSPIDGVRSFERNMGVLANTRNRKPGQPGRWILVPRGDVTAPVRRRSRVIKRRRQNFERLLAASAITFALGFVPMMRWMWFVHLAVDGALGFYITRLLRWKREEQYQARPIRPMPAAQPASAAPPAPAPPASEEPNPQPERERATS